MRRGRVFIYIAILLVLLVVAGFVVWTKFLKPPPVPVTPAETQPEVVLVNVVVVTQKIQRGTILGEDVLGVIQLPEDRVIPEMISDTADVIGARAKFDFDSGVFLTTNMLVHTTEELSDSGSNAALLIPKGLVAVTIPLERFSSIAYLLESGDHVNVIASMFIVDVDTNFQSKLPNQIAVVIAPGVPAEGTTEVHLTAEIVPSIGVATLGRAEFDPTLGETFYVIPSESQRSRLVTQGIIQNAIVLYVGEKPLEDPAVTQKRYEAEVARAQAAGEPPPPVPPPPPRPDIITLLVSPQDAVTLNYFTLNNALLSLAMRPQGDASMVEIEAVTLQYLLEKYTIPVPTKLPIDLEVRK